MRRNRIHLPGPLQAGETRLLAEDRAHYVTRVLRLRPGDELMLFDGSGGEYRATLDRVARRGVSVHIKEHLAADTESPLPVTLALGIARGERMDYAIQKAVELGVHSIVPLLTERCGVRLESGRALNRLEHWRRVTISACQQCGRNHLPNVQRVSDFSSWLDEPRQGLGLVFTPEADNGLADIDRPQGQPVTALIGPEGGLTQAEIGRTVQAGFTPVRLGPRVLRAETAAVAALTAALLLSEATS